jgi:hypothetical protein
VRSITLKRGLISTGTLLSFLGNGSDKNRRIEADRSRRRLTLRRTESFLTQQQISFISRFQRHPLHNTVGWLRVSEPSAAQGATGMIANPELHM